MKKEGSCFVDYFVQVEFAIPFTWQGLSSIDTGCFGWKKSGICNKTEEKASNLDGQVGLAMLSFLVSS